MIETSNLKQIKEKRNAVMIDYKFVTFDLLTYFYSDFTLMCRTIYCLVLSLSSNTHLWIVCEHFNLHVNFWPIDLIKFSAQRLNFPWKFSCLVKSLCKQRLHVLQKILNFSSSYYYYYSSSSSRQNLVRTSPPTVLMIQICHLVHIFI